MPKTPPVSTDRYAAFRAYSATQRQTTVDRLQAAITKLENDNRPVSPFTGKEVNGLDYMAYYRNKERESLHDVPNQPRDRLLNYKNPRLVALLRDALAERDQFQWPGRTHRGAGASRYLHHNCQHNTGKILFSCTPSGVKHGHSTSLNHPLSLLLSNAIFMHWMKRRMPIPKIEAFDASPMIRRLPIVISECPLDDTPGFKPNGTRPERTGSDRSFLLNTSSTFHTSFASFRPAIERACTVLERTGTGGGWF